jgi:phosphatidylinositol alpha-1,6-mannosyltransferase
LTLLGIEVWRPLSRSQRRALGAATVRLAISETTRRRAQPFLGDRARACEVLHLALEPRSPAGAIDAELLERVGSDFLLIVGRMASSEAYKGHDQVFDALRILAESRRDPPPRLVVIGGGDDRERLEAKSGELGLADRVRFTGHVSENTLAELYRRCAAFVMPSRGEGFGLVYLEAMRAGKPCIAVRGTVAEEIVVDRQTGRLVALESSRELADAIAELLDDPEGAVRLGAAGRARFQQHFSFARFEQGLHQHLDALTRL